MAAARGGDRGRRRAAPHRRREPRRRGAARPRTPRSSSTWACRASTRRCAAARARRARPARGRRGARALAELAGDRPVVMLSTRLRLRRPAATRRSTTTPSAAAARGRRRRASRPRRALGPASPRVVRVPWVYGPAGLLRDLIVGLRIRRYRIVGPGDNLWAMLGADDAAAALVAALDAPPGVYSAAEAGHPDPGRGGRARSARCPGHRRPDRVPPGARRRSRWAAR